MALQVSYSKLKSGSWGVRVKADNPFEELPAAGATLTVTLKSGETNEATVTRQVWSGEDDGNPIALYALD